ncbi:MAG: hypothetical protein JWP74_3760 [Marmoricola sp.]|nr:hypothetical protein [Marmoricola sp.]
MTDLINRPGRDASGPTGPVRPLSTVAALAGVAAGLITLVVCMSLALTGWFLADAGAHGQTTDALRVGADAWLIGHGSHLVASGLPIGIVPLAITMGLLLTAFRCGRWAARNSILVADDRVLGSGIAAFTGSYVVLAVLVFVLASTAGTSPSLGRTVLGAILVAALGGGTGMAIGTGRAGRLLDEVPDWVREVAVGAIGGALSLLAAGAILVALSLAVHLNEAATILSQLGLSSGDALTYTFVIALAAPNLALFGSAYLLGPGFAVGTGTTVSPTAVSLGVVPAFPVLAALPHEGPTPGWLVILFAVPAIAAGIGVVVSRRDGEVLTYDVAAMRGAGSGFAAGVLISIAISLAGGPMGTGRMADIGAQGGQILVFATGIMGVGGLLAGLGQAWWLRRGAFDDEDQTDPDSETMPIARKASTDADSETAPITLPPDVDA